MSSFVIEDGKVYVTGEEGEAISFCAERMGKLLNIAQNQDVEKALKKLKVVNQVFEELYYTITAEKDSLEEQAGSIGESIHKLNDTLNRVMVKIDFYNELLELIEKGRG